MNYNNPIPSSITRTIRIVCAVLFVAFSFSYLFFINNDLMAQAQYVFSDGRTVYSRFLGALIITFTLLFIQWCVAHIIDLRGRKYAITYFPSLLIMAVITSLNRNTIEYFSLGGWAWALPLLLLLFAGVMWVIHYFPDRSVLDSDYTLSRYMWPNLCTLLVMMLLCGLMSSADDVYLYELKTERLIIDEDYEAAGKVGRKSLSTSRRLNELRVYALAESGELGNHLFDTPQPWGPEGLIDLSDTVSRYTRFNSRDIQQRLGATAGETVGSSARYIELLHEHDATSTNRLLGDYYLSLLILQGHYHKFSRTIRQYYDVSCIDSILALPTIYRQALLLEAQSLGNDSLVNFSDTITLQSYNKFQSIMEEESDTTARRNRSWKDFRTTLWWYDKYMKESFMHQ